MVAGVPGGDNPAPLVCNVDGGTACQLVDNETCKCRDEGTPPLTPAGVPEQEHAPTGAERIAAERQRQIDAEGWTAGHDDEHTGDELTLAAATYALPPVFRRMHGDLPYRGLAEHREQSVRRWMWPWSEADWKESHDTAAFPEGRIRELVKAGALIAAEIDRLARAAAAPTAEQEQGAPANSAGAERCRLYGNEACHPDLRGCDCRRTDLWELQSPRAASVSSGDTTADAATVRDGIDSNGLNPEGAAERNVAKAALARLVADRDHTADLLRLALKSETVYETELRRAEAALADAREDAEDSARLAFEANEREKKLEASLGEATDALRRVRGESCLDPQPGSSAYLVTAGAMEHVERVLAGGETPPGAAE